MGIQHDISSRLKKTSPDTFFFLLSHVFFNNFKFVRTTISFMQNKGKFVGQLPSNKFVCLFPQSLQVQYL